MFGAGSFGQPPSFSSFGANKPATPTFATPGTSLFGTTNTSSGFPSSSSTSSTMFGQAPTQQSSSLFGFNQNKTFGSTFGGTTGTTNSMFGQQKPTLFSQSNTPTVSPFGTNTGTQPQAAGTSLPFNPATGNDTMMRSGVASPIHTRHQCITCMKEYESKSLEELRLEDYQLNRKGSGQAPAAGGMFGSTTQQTGGLFSSMNQPSQSSTFGQTNAFGNTPTSGGIFGPLNQPKLGGFFSTPSTSASGFSTNTGFQFNPPATQTGSLFATSTSTTGAGLGSSSFPLQTQQPQQQQPMNIFGSKPQASTSFTIGGSGSTMTNPSINKPVGFFGPTTNTSFSNTFGSGTAGSMFNQQQQNKLNLGSSFSGQSTGSAFGTSSGHSFSAPISNTPSLAFGTNPSTSFGTALNSFPTIGASTSNTSLAFGQSSTSANPSFTPSFQFNPSSNSNISLATSQNQNPLGASSSMGAVPFATTPFKDSPLFYNFITNRNVEEMSKPTSPNAQRAIKEASRRKPSPSFCGGSIASVKNLNFPVSKAKSMSKHAIFDGFEEDDHGPEVDILSPKSSVKRLSLQTIKLASPRYKLNSFPNRTPSNSILTSHGSLNDSECSRVNQFGLSSEDCSPGDSLLSRNNSLKLKSTLSCGSAVNGSKDNDLGIVCTRAGYYIDPPIEDLAKLLDEQGDCYVNQLKIGRHNYGEIKYLEKVNVANANIDEIVCFRHKEVIVYPDDDEKPPLGEGLNHPAQITLERVWPIDKRTKDPIKIPAKIKELGYSDRLKKACKRLKAEFISYSEETGQWIFRVNHFSRYSCNVEEEDDDTEEDETQSRGLGGFNRDLLKKNGGTLGSMNSAAQPKALPSTLSRLPSNGPPKDTTTMSAVPVQTESSKDVNSVAKALNETAQSSTISSAFSDADHMIGAGDVEMNPLTPSNSDDSDKEDSCDGTIFSNPSQRSITKVPSVHIQMMKSVLCEQEEETNDDPPVKKKRGSYTPLFKHTPGVPLHRGSFRRNMLPRDMSTSEIELVKDFEPVGKTCISTAKRPMKECLATLEASRQFPLDRLSCNLKNVRKCPRVVFGPGNLYCIVKNKFDPSSKYKGTVEIFSMKQTTEADRSTMFSNIVEGQLKAFQNSKLSLPRLKKRSKKDVSPGHLFCKALEDELAERRSYDDTYEFADQELEMWKLTEILWEPGTNSMDESHYLHTRTLFDEWLKRNAAMLFGDLHNCKDSSLLGYLNNGNREKAISKAVDDGCNFLALAMSQKVDVNEQAASSLMELVEQAKIAKYFDKEILLAYYLSSSTPYFKGKDFDDMTPAQWWQHFALYYWYYSLPHETLPVTVMKFQAHLQATSHQTKQLVFPSKKESSISNLCICLLKQYSVGTFPMELLLEPLTTSKDCLNYKIPWMLMENLKYYTIETDNEIQERITSGFAGQLEGLRLFKWAVFVLLQLDTSCHRSIQIQRILERNIESSGDQNVERFLYNELAVDKKTIYAIKSFKTTDRKDLKIGYAIKSGNYQLAYDTFVSHLLLKSFTTGYKMDLYSVLCDLRQHSKRINNWHVHGELCFVFQKLVRRVRYLATLDDILSVKSFVSELIDLIRKFTPCNNVDAALMLEFTLKVSRIAEAVSINTEYDCYDGSFGYVGSIPILPEYKKPIHKILNRQLR